MAQEPCYALTIIQKSLDEIKDMLFHINEKREDEARHTGELTEKVKAQGQWQLAHEKDHKAIRMLLWTTLVTSLVSIAGTLIFVLMKLAAQTPGVLR